MIIEIFFLLILFYIYNFQIISNLAKLEFVALNISGKNYLSWVLDVEIHLDVMNLENTIKEENDASL